MPDQLIYVFTSKTVPAPNINDLSEKGDEHHE